MHRHRKNDVAGSRSVVQRNAAFCPSPALRDFSTRSSRKSHGFARVLGRKLRFGRNDKRGEKADDKSGKTQSVDSPSPSFRAQSRNLTIKRGRHPFVRRCRSEISPLRATHSGRNDKRAKGRNDKRGEKVEKHSRSTYSSLSFRLSRGGQNPPRRTEKSDGIVRSTLKRRREKRVP